MKRLGIFSFYDAEGVVDDYVGFLLKELKTVVDELKIVVNGTVDDEGKKKLSKFSANVIFRENKGFDAGAYAEVLRQMTEDDFREWDELILCNDTFYGPFMPMKEIFAKMSNKETDFWGLNIVDRGLMGYVQSYFLVFRKKIISSGDLNTYMYNHINPEEENITNIYAAFESGLFEYLVKKGYKYNTYTNTELCDIYKSAHICIEKYDLPILKKKSFECSYIDEETQIYTIQYLYYTKKYNVEYILRNAKRQYGFSWNLEDILDYDVRMTRQEIKLSKSKYTQKELVELVKDKEFYIYGAGVIARKLHLLYFQKEKKFQGFVVSDSQDINNSLLHGYPIRYYKEIAKNSVIILGVSNVLAEEIEKQISNEQCIICLWEK